VRLLQKAISSMPRKKVELTFDEAKGREDEKHFWHGPINMFFRECSVCGRSHSPNESCETSRARESVLL